MEALNLLVIQGAFVSKTSTSSAALLQIRGLRCDFLFNRAARGLPVHPGGEEQGERGHVLTEAEAADKAGRRDTSSAAITQR